MITILGYIYFFCSVFIVILLSFNYSFCNWLILPKNKNIYLQFELFFVLINGVVLITSAPFNWIIGILMIFHAYGVYVLLFTSADFYNSIEEFKEVVPQEKFLDLLAVLFYGIIGFIIIYSPFLIGGS